MCKSTLYVHACTCLYSCTCKSDDASHMTMRHMIITDLSGLGTEWGWCPRATPPITDWLPYNVSGRRVDSTISTCSPNLEKEREHDNMEREAGRHGGREGGREGLTYSDSCSSLKFRLAMETKLHLISSILNLMNNLKTTKSLNLKTIIIITKKGKREMGEGWW